MKECGKEYTNLLCNLMKHWSCSRPTGAPQDMFSSSSPMLPNSYDVQLLEVGHPDAVAIWHFSKGEFGG